MRTGPITEICSELALREPVPGRHHRQRLQPGYVILGADPHEHARLAERTPHHLEQRDALFEHRQQLAGVGGVGKATGSQQPRGAVNVERVLAAARELGERRRQAVDERAFAPAEPGVGEPPEQHPSAEREAADALVEVLAGPGDEPGVDR